MFGPLKFQIENRKIERGITEITSFFVMVYTCDVEIMLENV